VYAARGYHPDDIEDCRLAFACTNSREVTAAVANDARRRGIWCNVADDVAASDFHGAAAVRRGDICIGITTGGASPALARHLKAKAEESIGAEYTELLELLGERRALLQEQLGNQGKRASIWYAILESEALELLKGGRRTEAVELVDNLIARHLTPGT
jgi:precorrin-2 dehydrogenase/sirohydrochlorin ferrochelatase